MNFEAYWRRCLRTLGADERAECGCVLTLGSDEAVSSALIDKVLSGEKTATASCLSAYEAEGEPLPKAGTLGIVADCLGNPRCVVEILAVTVLPFRDVTAEMCKKECEAADLAAWRRVHEAVFAAEGEAGGYVFSWDTPVVFVAFRTVFS